MRLFSYFLDIIFPPRDTEALVRDATVEQILAFMQPHTRTIDGHGFTTLLPYWHPLVRALVVEAKFKGNTRAVVLLGAVLQAFLQSHTDALLIPIPLSASRLRERGYNQTEEIVRAAGQVPMTQILKRTRDTLPQTALSGRSRRHNVERAFIAFPDNKDDTYIVFDDVATTGATLRDALRALKEAGATHIELLALAH